MTPEQKNPMKVKMGLFLSSRVQKPARIPGALWGQLGNRGVPVLQERAAAEGRTVPTPPGCPRPRHLPLRPDGLHVLPLNKDHTGTSASRRHHRRTLDSRSPPWSVEPLMSGFPRRAYGSQRHQLPRPGTWTVRRFTADRGWGGALQTRPLSEGSRRHLSLPHFYNRRCRSKITHRR